MHRPLLALVAVTRAIVVIHASEPAPNVATSAPDGAFATVHGAKLWYRTEGTGEPLLLIEGGPGAWGYMEPYFSELKDHFTVIHFRGLGRGQSDHAATPAEYTFDRDLEDIEGFRQALGLGPINLFGHSYGGMLAIGYALKYPTAVTRLVAANGHFSAAACQASNDSANAALRDQYPEVWEKLMALRARGLRTSSPECTEAMRSVSLEGLYYLANVSNAGKLPLHFNMEIYFAIWGDDADFQVGGSINGLDFAPRLRELAMPMLVIASRFDRAVIPRYAVQFRTYAPQAEFMMFEASGHTPFFEEHDKFITTLRTFLIKPPPTENPVPARE